MNIVFVISSPTGVGKTTLCAAENIRNNKTRRVITHTTRKPRPDEKNGLDYYFVGREEFENRLKNGEFIEYAVVHNNYYGTSRSALLDVADSGNDALLAVDVQGARNIVRHLDNAVSIFMLPPSFNVWLERIKKDNIRNDIGVRLKTALNELNAAVEFDYCIINDKMEKTVFVLESIIESQRSRMMFVKGERMNLINSLKEKTLKYLEED